jgi:hypothetical protein
MNFHSNLVILHHLQVIYFADALNLTQTYFLKTMDYYKIQVLIILHHLHLS